MARTPPLTARYCPKEAYRLRIRGVSFAHSGKCKRLYFQVFFCYFLCALILF